MNLQESVLDNIKYNQQGLIPAIVQESDTGEVLMLAYMNRESLERSLATGETWFYSRSRQELWHKGATSGHIQKIDGIYYDCDADTLLVKVKQTGEACHEGYHSCFHYELQKDGTGKILQEKAIAGGMKLGKILEEVYRVILDRQKNRPEKSYTTYLFEKGVDKILKKVGEETAEVIIAAKNNNPAEVVYEVSDLLYHLLVLLVEQGVNLEKIAGELQGRR
ncbi:bifunctional phosphoribosyl-AMP cyclohydrolase/phosphoribosyl-ATP diphosphatase HisIE [Zhaonella formicivorans]|jgi:phosphoribosyl-ATP pyrophosphohydrolase/phosphoribosyl-AMP cyclohydrolase|uniref:bifunctional phosphoribosyl-AMP cyclohydrolase/phosphoribosyl-ATP diphosphatase HisIE n=1 Tax=Zhaonella formicivorans TaxID=2528593 RepID=UPI0010D80374|nr:bifunctional phosphoribosyl-AMP cyclohydrolase/phosphoribosyl-ATP diphosphatase HisIE [Zhaonella formicivorans]